MIFTYRQIVALHAGHVVTRHFPAHCDRLGTREPCPFKVGQDYSARKDGARNTAMRVCVTGVEMIPNRDDGDWHVLFAKSSAVPHVPRLLGLKGGYTDKPHLALGNGTDADPGEAVPTSTSTDLKARQMMAARELAVENAVGAVELLCDMPGLSREEKRRIRRIAFDVAKIRAA